MAWSQEEISKFEEIVTRLAGETHIAKAGGDEGLIPIFSLVNDILDTLPDEPFLREGAEAILEMIQPMLDDASPFNQPTVDALRTFAKWCANALYSLKQGHPVESYLATHENSPAIEAPAAIEEIGESEDEAPDDADILPIAEAPIPFQQAKIAIQGSNCSWSPEEVDDFSRLSRQFASELALTQADSDEGMLPVYSLLRDFQSAFDNHEVAINAFEPAIAKMDALLDAATPFDKPALRLLTELNLWMESSLNEFHAERDPLPFEPSADATAAAAPADEAPAAAAGKQDDGLLKEFSAYDIVMDLNMEENQELLQEFHSEAVDHLGQIEAAVLELEQDVGNRDAINSMFRSFHTIKGVAGFLNLIPVNRLAHEVESMMDLVRNDKLPVFTGVIDLVLESKDAIAKLIEQITVALSSGIEPKEAITVSRLMARARWAMKGPDEYAAIMGDAAVSKKAASKAAAKPAAPSAKDQADEMDMDNALEFLGSARANAADAESDSGDDTAARAAARRRAAENATIRVNTTKLDNLMDMVGELVIVQSQLHECSKDQSHENSVFQRNMSQLTRITKELQHTSMALRMIPIKPTFQKMGRIVRDLSAKNGKKVRFDTLGEDTELDRNVVEEIGDPLVHMIRNALDHGLEPTEDRAAAGKDETGTVTLKAYHQGSSIVIELRDDGRGIDPERVLKKAIANGIVREDEQLSRDEIYKLIFAPGFSTAEKITDISGRGVGMDVVKKNIERLRGKIEIDSELGKGSTFRILLPLTMAIVDGLVVKVGADRFILPTTSVKVALRPDKNNLSKIQGNQEILNIRGKIIPLFRLHNHFAIPGAVVDPLHATVVIVETAGKPCGLLVDDMVSKQEVVIKSLGSMMQGIPGVSGGAILGDGTIALILDPASLISVA